MKIHSDLFTGVEIPVIIQNSIVKSVVVLYIISVKWLIRFACSSWKREDKF